MIRRSLYLERIHPFFDSPLIKVITGVRRCGKSVLLRQIRDELEAGGAAPEQLTFIDFDDYDNRNLLDPEALHAHVKARIEHAGKEERTYLLFDEIQNVSDFEVVVNSLNNRDGTSLFITGSNSKLLSGELATKLGGRTLSLHMMPFNFREFCEFEKGEADRSAAPASSPDDLLLRYLKWGGFPLVCAQSGDESKRVVLDNLYSSIVLRDIIQRNRISSAVTLENVLDYLIANSSATISGNGISAALSDSARKVSAPTVYDMLRSIEESYVISKVERFDIRGKKILSFEAKEYVCDLGLFQMRKNRVKDEWSCIVETAVFNELVSRGLHVYIGKTHRGEIDFIAEQGGKRCYIQATYLMPTEETRKREFGAFSAISDNHPKYVISMDPITMSQEGIVHLRLVDFLSDESLLHLS